MQYNYSSDKPIGVEANIKTPQLNTDPPTPRRGSDSLEDHAEQSKITRLTMN